MKSTFSRAVDTELGPRAAHTILAAILVGVGFRSILGAYEKPLWFDEILTVIMCRLPSLSKLWQALDNATDTNPPLFIYDRALDTSIHLGRSRGLSGTFHLGIVANSLLYISLSFQKN